MTTVHGFCAMHAYSWLEAEGTVPRPVIMSATGSLSLNGTVVPSPNKESRQVRAGRSGIRGSTVRGRVR